MLRNLKAEMIKRNVTRERLAEAMGVSTTTVYNKVYGIRPVKPAEKMLICDTLGIPYTPETCEYLFRDVEI